MAHVLWSINFSKNPKLIKINIVITESLLNKHSRKTVFSIVFYLYVRSDKIQSGI